MKMNKTVGRVATTLVATAMLASLAAPAYAASATGAPDVELNKITITKRLEMPKSVTVPVGQTFTFNIEEATVTGTPTITSANKTFDVKSAPAGSTVNDAGSTTITSTTTTQVSGSTDKVYVTAEADLTLPSDTFFTDAGVYKYTITEDSVDDTDYVDHTQALDLYLFVQKNTADEGPAYIINGAVIYPHDQSATGTGKTDVYTNYYMLDEDGDSKVGSLKIEKVIDGTMASPNDEFTFTITGLDMSKTYTTDDSEVTLGKVDEHTTVNTITLKGGQSLTINGVDAGDGYVVKENANIKGYSIDAVLTNDNDDDRDDDVNYNSEDNSSALKEIAEDGVTVSVNASKETDVTFTNTRNAVSPTGIVMNVAPYALLVVIAAAGCFVFLRKRRED